MLAKLIVTLLGFLLIGISFFRRGKRNEKALSKVYEKFNE